MPVVQQAIKHSADRGRVAQQFALFHRSVRSQHGAGYPAASCGGNSVLIPTPQVSLDQLRGIIGDLTVLERELLSLFIK